MMVRSFPFFCDDLCGTLGPDNFFGSLKKPMMNRSTGNTSNFATKTRVQIFKAPPPTSKLPRLPQRTPNFTTGIQKKIENKQKEKKEIKTRLESKFKLLATSTLNLQKLPIGSSWKLQSPWKMIKFWHQSKSPSHKVVIPFTYLNYKL